MKTNIREKSYKGVKKKRIEPVREKSISERNEIKRLAKIIDSNYNFFRIVKG